jgi:DNA polymerase-3 subunit beta
MKVSCTQEALARGLGIVGRAVSVRSPNPITSNVLIATDRDRIKLVATDAQTLTMTCWIEGQVEEEGAITVPARLLTDYVNSRPSSERITMSLAQRSKQLRVVCERNSAVSNEITVSGIDADDFPPPPAVKDGVAVALDPKELRQAVAQTVFAAATDDSRPILTGVDTIIEGNKVTLAASDGFRLSRFKLTLAKALPEKVELVIPARALGELSRLLADEEGEVTLQTDAAKSRVLFRLSNVEMVAQLIQGTFPNISQLIPESYTSKATVAVSDFLREIRTASVFARDGSGIVRLVVTPGDGGASGQIRISARAEEMGDEEGTVDAAVEGDGVKIAFNGKYLSDVLQALDSGEISLETSGPSSQGAFKPVGANDSYVHIIMPMFVQW